MKLNCKPGDLAVIVQDDYGPQQHLGKIITVGSLEPAPNMHGETILAWSTTPVLYDNDGAIALFADVALRPIRDAGDDAVDESHAYRPPVPHKETA